MSRLKSKTTPGDTLPAQQYPIDALIQKMDVDGDAGRRGFGLRGQRRGTGSDKGTAVNSLSGYHAPGLKKILACLQPCHEITKLGIKLLCEPWSRNALVVAHYLVNVRIDLRMKDKPHQLRRLSTVGRVPLMTCQGWIRLTVHWITLTPLLTAFREYGGAFGDRVSMRASPIYASRWKKFLTRDKRSCCSIATW